MMLFIMRLLKTTGIIFGSLFAGLILLVALVLMFLPYAVSSPAFQSRLVSLLEDKLDHGIHYDAIDWSWRRGITVTGLSIHDHPDFSEAILASAHHIYIDIEWSRLINGTLAFAVRIVEPRITIIRTPDGRVNIADGFRRPSSETPAEEKENDAAEKQRPAAEDGRPGKDDSKAFSLPVDIAGTFEVIDLSVVLDDRQAGRRIAVTDAGIRLALPSVRNDAIRLDMGLDISVDHEALPRSSLSAVVVDLFDASGGLTIHTAAVDADISLPGLRAILKGDMKDAGATGEIAADLGTIAGLAHLFDPGLADRLRPSGRVQLKVIADGMPDGPIAFDIRMTGDDLGVAGALVDHRDLSSGRLRIHSVGTYDAPTGNLTLSTGEIQLQENTGLNLSGRLSGLTSENPAADLTLASLDMDIDEIVGFLGDFIPDAIRFSEDDAKTSSIFTVRNLSFAGGLKSGEATVACQEILLTLPGLIIAPSDRPERISIARGRIAFSGVTADLVNFLPVSAAVNAAASADAVELTSEDRNLSIAKVNLEKLELRGHGLRTDPNSPYGVSGTFSVTESLTVGSISIGSLLDIRRMHQRLDLTADLDPGGILTAAVESFRLNAERAAITPVQGKTLASECRFEAVVPEFTVKALSPLAVDVSGFQAGLSLEDALTFDVQADIADTGRSMIRGRARLKTDLDLLVRKAGDFIGPDMAGAGMFEVSLDMDGRLPDEQTISSLAAFQPDDNLDFIRSLAVNAKLADGSIRIGPNGDSRITIGGISGDPLISYTLNGPAGDGILVCRWQIEHIDGIPSICRPPSGCPVHLSLDGAHHYFSALDLNQHLEIKAAGIRQVLGISLDGLDRLWMSGRMNAPYAAFSRVGARISAGLDLDDLARLEVSSMPDMKLNGSLSVRTGLHLIPGSRISGNIRIDLDSEDLNLNEHLTMTSPEAALDFGKAYRLVIRDPDDPHGTTEPDLLSRQVLEPEQPVTRLSGPTDHRVYRHMKQMKERTSPSSELSVESIAVRQGPFPVNVGPSRILLDMVDGLPGISYFQVDLLGGTLNGSVNLAPGPAGYHVKSALNFSGINTAAFLPEVYSGKDDPRAEIRGMVYADIPVTPHMPVLLENMAVSIEFTKIGSLAIERLLYALDPHESNEAIMAQRRILKNGSPKWIRLQIRDGFLSIQGEATVKTVSVPLPAIQRLNIARLPGIEKFVSYLGPMEAVAVMLDRLSAETLTVDSDGRMIMFK
jgi:hypothetical protein